MKQFSIEEYLKNPDRKVIGYAGSDGSTEETCDFVCFDAQNNTENSYEDEQPC